MIQQGRQFTVGRYWKVWFLAAYLAGQNTQPSAEVPAYFAAQAALWRDVADAAAWACGEVARDDQLRHATALYAAGALV